MSVSNTIAAVATPPGLGGVGVIRVSGPEVPSIIQAMLGGDLDPRQAKHTPFLDQDGAFLDEGIALYFPKPNSFTGEDVLELQGHGSPVVQSMILEALIALGARLARPGEFSERAFLNGKKDLTEVEAIADVISAQSRQAAKMAIRSMRGVFSQAIQNLSEHLIQLRMYVEAAIDFPEEEIDFLSDLNLQHRFDQVQSQLEKIITEAEQGVLMKEGIRIVIAGKPNAGKSSLLNWFCGEDKAIVTNLPGTTRDLLSADLLLEGVPIHLIDTAGIRETDEVVEQEGIRRAIKAIEGADQIIWCCDSSQENPPALPPEISSEAQLTILMNKIDLSGQEARIDFCNPEEILNNNDSITSNDNTDTNKNKNDNNNVALVYCSLKTEQGLEAFKQHLLQQAGFNPMLSEGLYSARNRHVQALKKALDHCHEARSCLEKKQGELLAEELKLAHEDLGEILGEFRTDDLLAKIFSEFCIGK